MIKIKKVKIKEPKDKGEWIYLCRICLSMLTQTYHFADEDDPILAKYSSRFPHEDFVRVEHAYVKNWPRHLCDRVIK